MDKSYKLLINENTEKVVFQLKTLFENMFDHEIIESVAFESNFDLQKSSDLLLEMSDKLLSTPNEKLPNKFVHKLSNSVSSKPIKSRKALEIERVIRSIESGYKVLVIMRGVPGCGKSYLAAKITEAVLGQVNTSCHILSSDDYFIQNQGYVFNPHQLPEAHEWNQRRAFKNMSQGVSPVIIDNTNIKIWEMKPYATMATDYGYIIEILEPDTWWCFKENELVKRNTHNVPKAKIKDMLDNYEHNITANKLLSAYSLKYKFQKLPQFRLIPPLHHTKSSSVIDSGNNIKKSKSTSAIQPRKNLTLPDSLTKQSFEAVNLMDFSEEAEPNLQMNYNKNNTWVSVDEILMCSDKDDFSFQPNLVIKKNNNSQLYENIENAWGVNEKAFETWDIVTPITGKSESKLYLPNLNKNVRKLETKNNETCIELDDVKAINQDVQSKEYRILKTKGRDINAGNYRLQHPIQKKTVFDKSCMTDEINDKDEVGQLNDLLELFPKIPQIEILDLYNRCNKNFNWTLDLLIEDKSEYLKSENNHKKQQTDKVFGLEEKTPSTSTEDLCSVESYSDDISINNILEINLSEGFVNQLETYFGEDDAFPKGFQPVIQMPVKLARQIYALYIESVCSQMDAQNNILERLEKEDEEFAKKLQLEEEHEIVPDCELNINDASNSWKMSAENLAQKLTKQKLYSLFPKVDPDALVEVLQSHNNDYTNTMEDLMASVGVPFVDKSIINQRPINVDTLNQMKEDEMDKPPMSEEGEPATYYREVANMHLEKRSELYEKAQHYQELGMREVALFYSSLAKKETFLFDKANNFAAHVFSQEHSNRLQKFDTLDLHFLYVKEAITNLDVFIDRNINLLNGSTKVQNLYIITGKGKHSQGGKSKIKPAVIQRLKKRRISYVAVNPGLLKIKVCHDSILTTSLSGV